MVVVVKRTLCWDFIIVITCAVKKQRRCCNSYLATYIYCGPDAVLLCIYCHTIPGFFVMTVVGLRRVFNFQLVFYTRASYFWPVHLVMRHLTVQCYSHPWSRFTCCGCQTIMMTSSNGNISALLAICAGNSLVPGEFPTQRPVTRGFDVFFDLRLNERLSKQ